MAAQHPSSITELSYTQQQQQQQPPYTQQQQQGYEQKQQQLYTQQPPPATYQPQTSGQPYTQHPPATYQPQMSAGENQGPPQRWINGFWSCCKPMDTCCLGYWCPCILFGRTQQRLVDPQLERYEKINGNCLMWCGLSYFGVYWALQMIKRGEFRQRFNLEGSAARDCFGAYCCPWCGLVQEEKECKARMGGSPHAVVSQQGYQKNDTMGYNPPPK